MKLMIKKSILSIAIALLSIYSLSAQTVKWDSTYRPAKYVELVTKFKAETPSPRTTISF